MRVPSILRGLGRRRPGPPPPAAKAAIREPWRRRDPPRVHVIGGRRFVEVLEGTLAHDLHCWALIRRADLESIICKPHENAEEHARALFARFIDSEAALELLACGLLPEGMREVDWSPAIATETARFLGSIVEPADKSYVQGLLVSLLEGFFLRGIVSLWTSPTYSGAEGPETSSPTTPPSASGTP